MLKPRIDLLLELDPNNEIYIMREDLLPFSFGGNKVRIAKEFFDDMENKGGNCIVGYGNIRSNLCRVLANMAYKKGIECHIIAQKDNDFDKETLNSILVKCYGAIIHYCQKDNVAETVDDVMDEIKTRGLKPYYIYGDKFGRGNEAVPVKAYVKAYQEIEEKYDYIFLATGTGMTQAGLIAGKILLKRNEKIVGISIARKSVCECEIIRKYVNTYFNSMGGVAKLSMRLIY